MSVTLDGIPEVMETQQVQETNVDSPGASSPEQPKRKKGACLTGIGHTVSVDVSPNKLFITGASTAAKIRKSHEDPKQVGAFLHISH